jgi:flap endonuclease-1
MGIRGLTSLLNKHAPDCVTTVGFGSLTARAVAIDSSILMYKYSHVSKGHEHASLVGFMNRTLNYLTNGILPVYVFDGKPPDEKSHILKERREAKRKVYQKIEDLEKEHETEGGEWRLDRIKELRRQITKVTAEQSNDVQAMLRFLGIPVVDSPGDAEKTCAFLQTQKAVDYTMTDDTDAFAFGADKVIKFRLVDYKLAVWDLEKILSGLGLTYDSFVDLCILCGCDYCQTIPKVGPVTAYRHIKKWGDIESVIENNPKLSLPTDYITKIMKSRSIFKDNGGEQRVQAFAIGALREEELRSFLTDRGFQAKTISAYLKRAKKGHNRIMKVHK